MPQVTGIPGSGHCERYSVTPLTPLEPEVQRNSLQKIRPLLQDLATPEMPRRRV